MGSCISASKDDVHRPSKKAASSPTNVSIHPTRNLKNNKGKSNIAPQEQNPASNAPKAGIVHNVDVIYDDGKRKEMSIVHKTKGNEYFKDKKYNLAIDEYTKAIRLFNGDSAYYSNRALCFKLLSQFNEVIEDADASIKIDPNNYKGHHLKGVALLELSRSEISNEKVLAGIQSLSISLKLAKGNQSETIVEEISIKLKKAKKVLWLRERELSQNNQNKANQTKDFINSLIKKDQATTQNVKDERIALVNDLMAKNSKADQEIPETYCCKITYDIMKTPVMGPSGSAYEHTVLLEHFSKTGFFDPITRQTLVPKQLVKNQGLIDAIDDFQDKNPWSYDYQSADEDYRQIKFV